MNHSPAVLRTRRSRSRPDNPAGRFIKIGGILLLVLVFSGSCERRPVKIRWKLDEGKTYVYQSEVTGTWKLEGWEKGERGSEFGNLIETEMSVKDIGDDSAFYITEKINLIREGQTYEPDVVEYYMSSNGKLYGVTQAVAGTAPRNIPGRESGEYRRQLFEQTQPTYPDRELAPGQTWIQDIKVVLEDRVLTAENQFEVKGWEKVEGYLCLRIDYSGTSFVPYESKGRKLLDQGRVKGSLWFAPQEGLLIQQCDSLYRSTARIVPEGEKPPSTYVVQSVRIAKLVEVR